ncbi:MAG: NAD-binding protein, partial [Pseudomonadales bacterium]
LSVFERANTPREQPTEYPPGDYYQVVILGLGRLGTAIATRLGNKGIKVLGLDFNPSVIKRCRSLGLDIEYGDITDADFVAELPLGRAHWIVSTIPQHHTGLTFEDIIKTIVQITRPTGFTGQFAATSQSKAETEELERLGVDLVLEPFQDAADRATELLLEGIESRSE